MNIKLPTIVYKCPGPHQLPGKKSYNYVGVKTKAEFETAIKNGFSPTLVDALAADDNKVIAHKFEFEKSVKEELKESSESSESPLPNRSELEEEAKKLKIRFSKSTSDKDLLTLISKKLAEQEE